ncbi:amidohydrolase family protein [Pseudofrankia inefficax]|uniref:Amidohydrolase 2 n=1 Tax=Pseudofrankia inefficax (strain DSM 45817 / CECT 9037 / DDB 130130 / EuI1c) TaxID=298654 RepID=E3JC88_PSEI1|nr:amidohydrolase family protein [Pseudofrankia inefficax]ADP83544.1 amidohydrolase 2 [Pseudofrankia inefficax]
MAGTERLISVDSHYQCTVDALKERAPAKFHDAIDYANRLVDVSKRAALQRRGTPPLGLGSYLHEAALNPGYSDPRARLKAMDDDGVDVEILFSDLSSFRIFYKMLDGWKETARAFADFSSEFAAADPNRLLVAYQIPLQDIDHGIAELERLVSDHGARTIHLPTSPGECGLPEYFDPRYDPLWARLQEMRMPVCVHLGVSDATWDIAARDPTPQMGVFTSQQPLRLAEQLGMLLLSGLFERFPDLQFVLVEPGLGWVPWYLNTLDGMSSHGYEFPALKDKPSAYFHRNISLTFMDERRGVEMRHEIGVDRIMWSTDFPHPACTWPNSRKVVADLMAGVPDDEAEKMVYGNARRIFNI